MKDKVIGLLIVFVGFFGLMLLMTPDIYIFLSFSAFTFTIGIGAGLTLLKKDSLPKDSYSKLFKENCIASAKMATIAGIIIMLPSIPNVLFPNEMEILDGDIDNFANGLAFILFSNLYGYLIGPIMQAFLED